MNSQQRNASHYNNSSFQKPLSSISQVQNGSTINIKPLSLVCRYHPDQICQNYCIQQKCFLALCSECIQQHLLHHKKQGLNDLSLKSFKSVRSQCSSKLIKIIDRLLSKLGILSQPKNPQQMLEDNDKQLESIRLLMHQIIDQEFNKIREAIKAKVSQNFATVKELNQIHQNLIKIVNQLKQHNSIISEGIIDSQINVGDSIEKTILLNENALLETFQKQSFKYDQKFKNINVQILFSENDFRQATLACLKMGSNNNSSVIYNKLGAHSKITSFPPQMSSDDMSSRLRSRSKSPINDRFPINDRSPINDKSLESSYYKKSALLAINYPVLHYFQTGQSTLHLIDLKGQPQKISISLGNFKVPTFHASLLSQKVGSLFISGGNIELAQSSSKSHTMSKFSLISNQFKRQFADVRPRSSHTLCQDISNDCIYILGGYGQTLESDHDESMTTFQTIVQRVYLKNGNVQEINSSNWGGACIALMSNSFLIKACMQGIQIFDSLNAYWAKINNVKGTNVDGVFCRGAGYSLLSSNSILIYGGYDENQQSRKECYLMGINFNHESVESSSIQVQKTNSTLPIAEGFWNNPGIFYQNNLWAIQNVQDAEGEPIQSERTLLKFNLEQKKWVGVEVTSKNNKKN